MNQVVKDQINLQNAMVASYSKNKEGKISSDLYIPETNMKTIDRTRVRLGMYNELLQSVAENTVKWGKNTQWAGRQLTVGFTVPLAMAAAATGKLAFDVDKALTSITKVYGDATDQYQDTTESIRKASWETAKNMSNMYGQSAKDTLEMTGQLAAAGATGAELQQATAAATKARTLNEIDLQTAIQASITMQTVYGYSAEELGQKWDYINAVANQTILSAEDFAIAIPKVANLLKDLGADVEDVGVLLTAMKAGGIDAAEGANALKSISFRSIATYGKGLATFKEATGQDLKQIVSETDAQVIPTLNRMYKAMEGLSKAKKIDVISDVFGIHQGNKAMTLLNQLALGGEQVSQAIAVGNNSIAENAAIARQELERMDAQPFKRIEKAIEVIKNEMSEIGQAVLPTVATALEKIGGLFSAISDMGDTKKAMIIVAAAAAAVAGPLLMLIGLFGNLAGQGLKFVGMLGKLTLRTKSMTPEQKAQELLAKKAASAYDTQGAAVARLTLQVQGLTDALVSQNKNAIKNVNNIRKTSGEFLAYGPAAMPPQSPNPRGPDGRFTSGGVSAARAAKLATADKEYKANLRSLQMNHLHGEAIKENNKRLEDQKMRYEAINNKISATVGIASTLMFTFGPDNKWVQSTSAVLSTMSTIAYLAPGLAVKTGQWATSFVKGNSKIAAGLAKSRDLMNSFMGVMKGAALPLAGVAAAVGIVLYKAGQEAEEATKKVQALVDSTEEWADVLKYNRVDPGTFARQAAKNPQDILAQNVSALKEKSPDLYEALSEKEGKSIGEKWGAALAQGASVKLSGGTAEAAREAVKIAMNVMNSGLSEVEIDAQLNINFENMDEVAKARVEELNRGLTEAVQKTSDGPWDSVLRYFGPDNAQLTESAEKFSEESTKTFTQVLSSVSVDKRKKFIEDYSRQFSDPLDEAYKKAYKKAGMSRKQFNDALKDASEQGQWDMIPNINKRAVRSAMGDEEFRAASKMYQAQTLAAKGLADINGMSSKLKNEGNLQAVAEELIKMASAGESVDSGPVVQAMQEMESAAGDLEAQLKSMQIGTSPDAVTDAYKGVMSGVSKSMFDFADNAWQEHLDGISKSFDNAADNVQESYDKKTKRMDDRHEKAQDSLEKRQEARQERLNASQERANKKLEKAQEARRSSVESFYDVRIKKIQDTIEAEQKAEDIRQKLFEKEKERIRRYSQMFSQNIDLNAAVTTGNFDEAAKIANDMQSQQETWSIDDAQGQNADKATARRESQDKQIKLLEAQKSARLKSIDQVEKAESESLKKRQEAENKALRAKFDAEKKSLQNTQQIEKERLAAQKKAADQSIANSKARTLKEAELERKKYEAELIALQMYTPRNEAEMKQHHAKLTEIYKKFGVDLTSKGKAWSGIIGTSMKSEVLKSTAQIANDKAWGTVGGQISTALLKGGFGMTPAQMGKWLNGGDAPAGSPFAASGSQYRPGTKTSAQHNSEKGAGLTKHKGGIIDHSRGGKGNSRAGHSGKTQNPSEVWVNALYGESVLNRKATDMLGADGVDALNSGKRPANTGPWGPTAGIAGLAAAASAAATKRLMIETVNAVKSRLAADTAMDGLDSGKYGGIKMSADQTKNAGVIMSVGKSMGASVRDLQIAIMTAMQESSLRNISHGDRDSLGLFQQRPSQGWGTAAQIMDPKYASRKFFSSLFRVKGRDNMPMTLAAQAVQRSAHPNAYARWEALAKALVGGAGATSKYSGFGAGINLEGLGAYGGLSEGGWNRPAAGRVSSEFGPRWGRLHDGIDIANSSGTPLYAARSGVVVQTRYGKGVGNYTQISHGGGIQTGYAHQSKFLTSVGSTVKAGQLIGLMGNTGNSTGPHLHFRYIKNGIARNPREILPQLRDGGHTLTEGLANLHPKETVLTKPLSSDLKEGITKFSEDGGSGGDVYNINLSGAMISSEDMIYKAIDKANNEKERRRGRSRRVGNG